MKPIPPFLLIIIFIFVSLFVTAQTTWKNSGPGGGSDLHFLKFDPTNENILYASGDIEGIFKTTDGGLSWQNINNNLARLPYGGNVYWTNDIVIDPQNSQKIYLCGGAGLWRSSNGGQQWDSLFVNYANDEPTMVSTIAVNSSNTNIIYMGLGDRTEGSFADYEPIPAYGGRTGLYKSTDGGTSWNKLNIPGFDTASIYSIHIVNENSDTILISTAKGIYRSLNGGASWTVANNGLPHTNCYMLKGTNISGTYTLFLTVRTLGTPGNVASFSGGFFRSDDFGNSWTDITSDLPKYEPTDSMFLDYWRFDINPSNPAHILIATTRGSHWDEAGIYGTWDADSPVPTWDLVFYPFHGGWMDSAFFIDPYVFDIVFSPSNPAKVAYCEEHVSISNDTGTTWQQKFTTQQGANKWKGNGLELMNTDAIAFHPTNPDVYFIGYDDFGLFRTDDNANSFSRLDPKQSPDYAPLPPLDGVKDIIIDPQIPTDIYISRWGGSQGDYIADYPTGGILYSSDNGNTFAPRVGSLPEGRCDLAMDMQSGAAGSRTLYCAVYYSGIYKTTNSGQSWTSVNTGFGAEAGKVWQIVIDPNNNQTLYAGLNTRGNGNIGIYKSTNGGQNWSLLNNTPAGDVLSLFVDNAGKIYAGITDNFDYYTSGGLYRSADGGNSWSEILDHSRVIDVQVHPLDTTIIVATGSPWYQYDDISPLGIHLTTDGGLSWQDVSAGINHTFFNFGFKKK